MVRCEEIDFGGLTWRPPRKELRGVRTALVVMMPIVCVARYDEIDSGGMRERGMEAEDKVLTVRLSGRPTLVRCKRMLGGGLMLRPRPMGEPPSPRVVMSPLTCVARYDEIDVGGATGRGMGPPT